MSGTSHLGPNGKVTDANGDAAPQAPSDGVGVHGEDVLHTGGQGAEPDGRGGR